MNIFDIMGPVMVGPLPPPNAGALCGDPIVFYLLGRNISVPHQGFPPPG